MTKLAALAAIASDNGIATAVNTYLSNINNQFENTLSLDGSTPNAMQADLDMNDQDIINVGNIDTTNLRINGVQVVTSGVDGFKLYNINNYPTRADFVAAVGGGLAVPAGYVVMAAGLEYIAQTGATAIAALPGYVPLAPVTPEHFGAVGDGVTDDRTAFIAAEATGGKPIVLTQSYYLSSNTGSTSSVYELLDNATVTMGTGSFLPFRFTDNLARTFKKKTNYSASNPVSTGEPTVYSLLDGGVENSFLINQWGRQNMVTPGGSSRTGVYNQRIEISHSGEGDGYGSYWSTFVTAHPRIASAVSIDSQNSGGMGNGQANAGSNQVNVYGLGDIVIDDKGYQSVSLFNYVGITYFDGTDGAYPVPRLGMFQLSNGANSIDANYLAGGNTKIGYDATKANVDWGAFAMKAGQKILFDATESSTSGKFAATAAGEYYMMKSPTVPAIVVGRGIDDAAVFRVEGASPSARVAIGMTGTTAYVGANTTAAENTSLSLRTSLAGVPADRLIVTPNGAVNIATVGVGLQMEGTQVLSSRKTGWTADTGTVKRTANATYSGTAEVVYTQATVQALMDKVQDLSQTIKALKDDFISHGALGA